MNYLLFLAWRMFRRARGGFISFMSFVSVLGIVVGVSALIVVMAVMNGFDSELRDKIVSNNPHILVYADEVIDVDPSLLKQLKVEGVKSVVPLVYSQVFIRRGNRLITAMLRGVPDSDMELVLSRAQVSGKFPKGEGVLVGKELAKGLGLIPGDKVKVLSPITSQPYELEVTGTFDTGMYEYDSQMMYADIDAVRDLLLLGNSANSIALYLEDPEDAGEVKRDLRDVLKAHNLSAITWMESNRSLFSALKLEKAVMFLILLLIVLVASFTIVSSLVVWVATRTREIGVLKALGLTDREVYLIFLLIGLFIGLLGALIGGIIGVCLAVGIERFHLIPLPADVYYISYLPARLSWRDSLIVLLSAIGITVASAVYPAHSASRIVPARALRYE